MRRKSRPLDFQALSVSTFTLAGILAVLAAFLSITSDPTVLGCIVVQVLPPADWLRDEPVRGAVVQVDRRRLRVASPPGLLRPADLTDRATVRATLAHLRSVAGGPLVVVPADGVSTQVLVSVAEDATTAGFSEVAVQVDDFGSIRE